MNEEEAKKLTIEKINEKNEPIISLLINPGTASAEELADFIFEISKLYRIIGGGGIQFSVVEKEILQ